MITKSRISVLALSVLIFAQSCKKSDLQETTPAPAAATTSTNNIAQLKESVAASTGFSVDKVSYSASEKEFTVDGDGIISLEDAQARFATTNGTATATTQRVQSYTVAASKRNIAVYVSSTVPAEWLSALDNAIANWNAAGSSIKFSRVSSSTTANLLVSTTYNTTNAVATSYYPDSYGNCGRKMIINTYHNGLVAIQKIFAMTHELGHIVGFTHTNATYGSLIPGTTDLDGASIMNATVLNWNSFTSYDQQAIHYIY